MGSLSIWHWLIVLAVVLVLFGGGSKISGLMGDFAKGLKSFKRNMADDESMEHGQPAGTTTPPLVGQQPGAHSSYGQAVPQPAPSYAAPAAAAAPYPPQPPVNHPG